MRNIAILVLALFLASCAPSSTTIKPTETVYAGTFEQVFSEVSNAVATQEFLSHQSGWVIEDSDQAGGFLKAGITGKACMMLFGCTGDIERQGSISVTLIKKSETSTAVSLAGSGDGNELMSRIASILDSKFGLIE